MEYRIITVNLTRRKDRWDRIYQLHLDNGVPLEWIERWPAHDGMNWKLDGHQSYDPHPELTSAALLATNNTPLLQKNPKYICDYCWHWTYYEAATSITKRDPSKLYILMVDDHAFYLTHDEIMLNIKYLIKHTPDFRFMQLYYELGSRIISGTRVTSRDDPENQDMPFAASGICSNLAFDDLSAPHGDGAVLMSTAGASLIVEWLGKTQAINEAFKRMAEVRPAGVYYALPLWTYPLVSAADRQAF